MKNRFIIPMIIVLIGVLAIGCSSKNLSTVSNNEDRLNRNEELNVETKIMFHDSEEFEYNITIPVFSSANNPKFLYKINNAFERDALYLRESLLEMSATDFEMAKKDDLNYFKYELIIDYEVHTMSNELLSVTTLNYQYTGGAHGLSIKVPYNFDLSTGEEVILRDLFKKDSNYRKIINEEIQNQIKEDPDKFFPDEVEVFSGISENQPFYIKDGKLFIYFGQYDIAPYASGIIDFEIPSNIIKNVVSSSFIK